MYQKRKIKSNHGSIVASERQPYDHVISHSGDNNACAVLRDRPVPKKIVPFFSIAARSLCPSQILEVHVAPL